MFPRNPLRLLTKIVVNYLFIVSLSLVWLMLTGLSLALAASGGWVVNGSGNWNDDANWDGPSFPNAATDTAIFGSAITAPQVVTIDGLTISISEITFDNLNSYTVAAANGGSLAFAGSGSGQITVSDANGDGAHTIAAPIILSRNLTVDVITGSVLSLAGDISNDGSNRSLTKNGPGTLLLSGNNSYDGDTTVNVGTLALGSDQALSSGTLKPAKGTHIRAEGDRIIGNNLTLQKDLVFEGDSLGFTRTIQLPGNRLIVVNNTTSFAKITDPAGTRNFRKTGSGTLNLNFSGSKNPGDFIRNEGSSTGPFNMYGVGAAGRIVYYSGSGSLLAPGDVYDVATGAVVAGTGSLTLGGEIILHPDVTLDIDLDSSADYDRLTYNDLKAGCDCVELNEAALDVTANFVATPGTTFTLISRAGGSGLIEGNFKDLPQGAVFESNGQQFLVNYLPFSAPTEVRLTRLAVPTLGIEAVGGSGQSTKIGTDFSLPLQAKVVDSNGDPVPDTRVTFAAPTSGPSATFPVTNTALSDSSGVVTIPVRANSIPGGYAVMANIGPDGVTPVTFTLTNTAKFNLTIATNGAGSVVLDPPGSLYDYGAVITLTANPDAGSIFEGWSGDIVSLDNPLVFTVEANTALTATFTLSEDGPHVVFLPIIVRND